MAIELPEDPDEMTEVDLKEAADALRHILMHYKLGRNGADGTHAAVAVFADRFDVV